MAFQPAIMSISLGRGWIHDFDNKMTQAAKVGFRGIELFIEDLENLAGKIPGDESTEPTSDQLLQAAKHARATCDSNGLTIITLQPFLFYDGLKDRVQHARLLEKAKLWFRIAGILGTSMIQVSANFLPADQLTADRDIIASDLRELANLGAQENPPIRFAYENLCWSTHITTWQDLWDIVCRVDRPNFGMVLDGFNIAGRVWADPTSPTGKTPNADVDLKKSLEELVRTVDPIKVFYFQLADAERLEKPLLEDHPFHVPTQPPRMSWSRNAWVFPYEVERGGYLPIEDVTKAVIQGLGYKGYVSLELFSRTMVETGEHVPAEHAQRGMRSWKKLVDRLGLDST
ncbi:hypothetical protein NW762_004581 [Fusarium torreyae]|uniref:Xylose isomerase-like TIM barrel domain-containing protein n=1 Tax=Fusarium torreyae TaxID=1237075 RepID=A0A9W8VH29_9HYPO|nr:hypothetical protein NW762_004581 [Fusarium torreyae]